MEAKDLMIDDYVQFYDGTICRIENIYKADAVEVTNKNGTFNAMCDRIYPVPLTLEILEQNGFYYWGYDNLYLNTDENITVHVYTRKDILDNDNMNLFIDDGLNQVLLEELKYVHTLQHAMKFCNIKKEIVL